MCTGGCTGDIYEGGSSRLSVAGTWDGVTSAECLDEFAVMAVMAVMATWRHGVWVTMFMCVELCLSRLHSASTMEKRPTVADIFFAAAAVYPNFAMSFVRVTK